MTARANAWRKVEELTGDKRIFRKHRDRCSPRVLLWQNVLLETMTLIEKQQQKVQLCEKQLDKKKCGSEESGQGKNGLTENGDWTEGKFKEETDEG